MKSNGAVYLDPAPFCRLKTLGTSSLDFFSNCWCDSSDYWNVYYYIVETVYNEFKKNGIDVPFTQMEVRTYTEKAAMPFDTAPLPERKEKLRKKEKTPMRELIDDINKKIEDQKQKQKAKKRKKK